MVWRIQPYCLSRLYSGVPVLIASRIARQLGFVGVVEYRHVFSRTGGAQYGRRKTEAEDMLIVYAEAFVRDANPGDFSLTAILAHERGHQLLVRHPRIAKQVEGRISEVTEEILASLLGAMLCNNEIDRENLTFKAVAELTDHGEVADIAFKRLQELKTLFEALL
jgi:hypothetical protein